MHKPARTLIAAATVLAGLAFASGLRAQDTPAAADSKAGPATGGSMPMMQMMDRMSRMIDGCSKMMASASHRSGHQETPAPKKDE